jgi:Ala-tRNA(Pro) deacylase
MMAVLPASHHVKISDLSSVLGRAVRLATEDEVSELFPDCSTGAIPSVGAAYGVDMAVDDSLAKQPEVYFEGGDHTSLVQVSAEQFFSLMQNAAHGHFSTHD